MFHIDHAPAVKSPFRKKCTKPGFCLEAYIYVTVLAKRDHFVVKQTFENGAKITNYRKAYGIRFFAHIFFLGNFRTFCEVSARYD